VRQAGRQEIGEKGHYSRRLAERTSDETNCMDKKTDDRSTAGSYESKACSMMALAWETAAGSGLARTEPLERVTAAEDDFAPELSSTGMKTPLSKFLTNSSLAEKRAGVGGSFGVESSCAHHGPA